jgi:hypothetical protein
MGPAVRTLAPIQRGTVVYGVADPRRHGIVHRLLLRDGRFTAKVRWIDTSERSYRPVADLRRVTADTPSRPVQGRRLSKPKIRYDYRDGRRILYGHHDGPVVFNLYEAWWCYQGEWKPMSVTEAVGRAGVLSEADWLRVYGPSGSHPVPPLPDAAFCSGWRSPLV